MESRRPKDPQAPPDNRKLRPCHRQTPSSQYQDSIVRVAPLEQQALDGLTKAHTTNDPENDRQSHTELTSSCEQAKSAPRKHLLDWRDPSLTKSLPRKAPHST